MKLVLIEKWDSEYNLFNDKDPVEHLKYLMAENSMKVQDLVEIIEIRTLQSVTSAS